MFAPELKSKEFQPVKSNERVNKVFKKGVVYFSVYQARLYLFQSQTEEATFWKDNQSREAGNYRLLQT